MSGGGQARRRCHMQRYRTRIDAPIALARIQHRDDTDRRKQETRPYKCERCYGWHLTSKPKRSA